MTHSTPVSGLLLTGGTSRRLGADKASQTVGGVAMGALAGRALQQAARQVLVVGHDPGLGLPTIDDDGLGPLAAMVSGLRHLARSGPVDPVLVVACDLPFVTPALLTLLAGQLGSSDAAVPVSAGRLQPLAACYCPAVLTAAEALLGRNKRSMGALLECIEVRRVEPDCWHSVAHPSSLMDVDTPDDLRRANRLVGEASR